MCNRVDQDYATGDAEEQPSFCRSLIRSNRINWATVFQHVDKEAQLSRSQFKAYIKDRANTVLADTTHQKFMPTHFVPRAR